MNSMKWARISGISDQRSGPDQGNNLFWDFRKARCALSIEETHTQHPHVRGSLPKNLPPMYSSTSCLEMTHEHSEKRIIERPDITCSNQGFCRNMVLFRDPFVSRTQKFPCELTRKLSFFTRDPRRAVLNVMTRDPHLIERAQEWKQVAIFRIEVPESNDHAYMTAFCVTLGKEDRPRAVKSAIVGREVCHLEFFDLEILFG